MNHVSKFFLETVKKHPKNIAVQDDQLACTFEELFRISFNLSDMLLDRFSKKNEPIFFFSDKSVDSIISLLAISLSGNFYVPLDSKTPIERIIKQLNQFKNPLLIVSSKSSYLKDELSQHAEIILYDFNQRIMSEGYSIADLVKKVELNLIDIIDTDPCYIIFTSGSTGTPKGVVISHRGVIDYIQWANNEYKFSENEIIANQAPFFFDNSTLDIYVSFSNGCKLLLWNEKMFLFPQEILTSIREENVTSIFWVPSVLVSIANSGLLKTIKLPSLKRVLFAGEQMPIKQINQWADAYKGVLFSNLYGPTEITVDCTFYSFKGKCMLDELPIGYACKNTNILVLDDDDTETKTGEIGELCVRGSSLALGYWKNKEKTDEVFVQNPLHSNYRDIIYRTGDLVHLGVDGLLTFKGRIDSQVKIHGYRIELGEIESAVNNLEYVASSCVILSKNSNTIILIYEPMGDGVLSSQIRKDLQKILPKYMIPKKIESIKKIPLNKNGKIDRLKIGKNYG